jgi:hypothetical protein
LSRFFDFFEGGIKNIKFNSTPHPNPLLRSGEGREGKNLTAPLTFILSRKGREKEKRVNKNSFTPHFCSLPQGERRVKEIFFKNFLPIC